MKRVIIFIFILILSFNIHSRAYSESKKENEILVINSYNKGLEWTDGIVAEIENKLNDRAQLTIEYMDTKKINDEQYYDKLYELYKYKYSNRKFEIIIVSDNDAFNFIKKYRKELFDGVPIIFCGINNYNPNEIIGFENITGVIEQIDIKETIDLAIKINKEAKRVFLIADDKTTGIKNIEESKYIINRFYPNLKIETSKDMDMDEIIEKLKTIPEDNIALLLSYSGDKGGEILRYGEIINKLSEESKIPIYGLWDFYLDKGLLGGFLVSSYSQGNEVGNIALKILDGEDIKNIKVMDQNISIPMFDYKIIKKYKIDQSILPKSSIIVNKPYNLYEEYRHIINSVVLFIIILITMNFILLKNIKRKTLDLQDSNYKLIETLKSLEETQNDLIESEKMAHLGNLLVGISHEINTPLGICITAITSFIEKTKMIKELYENGNLKKMDLNKYIDLSVESSNIVFKNLVRASDLIKEFKKIQVNDSSIVKKIFNMRSHIEDVLLILKPELKNKNISVNVDCDSNLMINNRQSLFTQILSIFIMNTINHGYEDSEKGIIDIKVREDDQKIYLIYLDYGRGIAGEDLEYIYEPFFTTKRNKGLLGLGLNIVYNIVSKNLHGKISCESKPNVETKFMIEIPKEEQDSKS